MSQPANNESAILEAIMGGNIEAVKSFANQDGGAKTASDESGNTFEYIEPNAETADHDPMSLGNGGGSGSEVRPTEQGNQQSNQDEETQRLEAEAAAAKAAEEKAKREQDDADAKREEGRDRIYTGHIPEDRKELIKALAENPLADPDHIIKKLSDSRIESEVEEEPDHLKTGLDEVSTELNEVRAKLREMQTYDEGYEDLVKKQDELSDKRGALAAQIAIREQNEIAQQQMRREQFAKAEAEAEAILPDLTNEDSDAFIQVSGLTQSVLMKIQAGKGPTTAKVGDQEIILDTRDPEFPKKAAQVVKARLEKAKAPEAKPGAASAKEAGSRPISPAPATSASSPSFKAPASHPASQLSIKDKLAAAKSESDIASAILGEGGEWRKRGPIEVL